MHPRQSCTQSCSHRMWSVRLSKSISSETTLFRSFFDQMSRTTLMRQCAPFVCLIGQMPCTTHMRRCTTPICLSVRCSSICRFERNYALSLLFRSNVADHAHAPMRCIRPSGCSDVADHAHAPMRNICPYVCPDVVDHAHAPMHNICL